MKKTTPTSDTTAATVAPASTEDTTADPTPAPAGELVAEEPTHRPTGLPGDALMEERRARYATHLQPNPLRTSQVPSHLRHLPEFVALEAERAAVRAVERDMARRHDDWQKETRRVKAVHAEAQRVALLDGTPPPPLLDVPAWPYADWYDNVLDDFHVVIEATEAGLCEENYAEYLSAVDAESAAVWEEVAEAQRRLEEAQGKLRPLESAGKALKRFRRGHDAAEPTDAERRAVPPRRYSPTMDETEKMSPREVEELMLDDRRAPSKRFHAR